MNYEALILLCSEFVLLRAKETSKMNIKETLTCNHLLVVMVDNLGFTFDTHLYSICKNWIFIKCLHLDKVKYEFCTNNNKYFKLANVDIVDVAICCCERNIRNCCESFS
jgi:hypothetical protein